MDDIDNELEILSDEEMNDIDPEVTTDKVITMILTSVTSISLTSTSKTRHI